MLIFCEYSSSSREKKVQYLLVYRILNYRGFALFRAFLRYIVGHLLLFSLFRCFREPVVMSAVHLERWNNLCRQKRTTFGTSANRKEQPFAGGTPPRTPPDSIFCIACKQQPGADQFTEGGGHFCTNFRIPQWAVQMDDVPSKVMTKIFGINLD